MSNLQDTARAFIKAGFFITPINRKIPILPSWNTRLITEEDWDSLCKSSIYTFTGFGLVMTPGVICLDFDNKDGYAEFLQGYATLVRDLPVESSGKGYHIFFKTGDLSITKQKLALTRTNEVIVEIPGQVVMAPSPYFNRDGEHKGFYEATKGEAIKMPTLTTEQTAEILDACRSLNRGNIRRSSSTQTPEQGASEFFNPSVTKFNEGHDITQILTDLGYIQSSYNPRRFKYPGSTSGIWGVYIMEDNTCFSHHGSDPLSDGSKHGPFDAIRIIKFNGDYKKAFEYVETHPLD